MSVIPEYDPRRRFISYELWQTHINVELAKKVSPELWREAMADEADLAAVVFPVEYSGGHTTSAAPSYTVSPAHRDPHHPAA